jgi:AraC-like DNA-binding protein
MYAELVLPRLQHCVEAFWSLEGDGGERRILPDGCIDFIFDLDTGFGIVVGTMKSSQRIVIGAKARRFGVRFAPGAAAAFIDACAHELTDGQAPLPELTRAAAFGLAERVAEADSHPRRARIVADFLEDRRARLRPIDRRVRRAATLLREASGRLAIATLARGIGLGERQLERLFRDHVGSRPKHFARVIRMQAALALLEQRTDYRASRALYAGFSDEPHLVREFRELTGTTPLQLFRERRAGAAQYPAANSKIEAPIAALEASARR